SLQIIKLMLKHDLQVKDAKVLILGVTFKEDCPDVRNTKVVDLVKNLNDYRVNTTIYDPWADPEEVKHEYGLVTTQEKPTDKYDVIVLAVAHEKFLKEDLSCFKNKNTLVYDIKGKLTSGYTARL
ncbi:MAG: nucleotide sugar dehydrogenase, partial [Maribacter sp.]|nr:nucleotide sugar dehydrogenase [Maribacter sp.]